jgi:DNA-binding GntR family transcriptional regulator
MQHRLIVEALLSRKPEAAERAMQEHIGAFQRNIMQRV